MPNRSSFALSASVLAAVVLAVGLAAQQPAPPAAPGTPPVFRSGVDSVTVDALVTDKSGRPITDLTAADFEVRESGRLQTIQAFKFVRIDDGRDDPAAASEISSFEDEKRETGREDNRL